jgi:DNA-binding transcriptional regulator YdaS (Cro superfamily)
VSEEPKTGIQMAVEAAGSQTELAVMVGVAKQSLQEWVARGYVPLERVEQISGLTGVSKLKLVNPKMRAVLSPDQGE